MSVTDVPMTDFKGEYEALRHWSDAPAACVRKQAAHIHTHHNTVYRVTQCLWETGWVAIGCIGVHLVVLQGCDVSISLEMCLLYYK